jgi:hypothetical protein
MLALLTFYYRLLGDANIRWFRYSLHSAVALVIASWIALLFASIFDCYPR